MRGERGVVLWVCAGFGYALGVCVCVCVCVCVRSKHPIKHTQQRQQITQPHKAARTMPLHQSRIFKMKARVVDVPALK